MKKRIILFVLLGLFILGGLIFVYIIINKNQKVSKKVTESTNLSKGEIVIDHNINLNNYSSNITINDGGEYTLSGNFKYSIIIDTITPVTINLNNADIESSTSGAIINKGTGDLNINLANDSINTVSDGGTSAFDAAIYSTGKLTLNGTGKLTINGNQTDGKGILCENGSLTINDGIYIIKSALNGISLLDNKSNIIINKGTLYIDAGGNGILSSNSLTINDGTLFIMSGEENTNAAIKTKIGYEINGGTVIAIANNDLESPLATSKQKTMCFKLQDDVGANSIVSLKYYNNEIITFKGTKKFNNLIISTKNIYESKYSLYKDGNDTGTYQYGIYNTSNYQNGVKINDYEVTKTVNEYEN